MRDRLQEAHARLTEGRAGFGLRAAARAASWAYGLGARLDAAAYQTGLREAGRLPAPVIGVGGITAGGAGKTPLTMAVVQALGRLGLPAAVISRGYGRRGREPVTWVSLGEGPLVGAAEAGDEPVMMARRLAVPVAVGPDRRSVGLAVLARLGPRVLVGDDLFQHRRLARDLDIVALDAARPLDGGALLPRGSLREPVSALGRAHAVVFTRTADFAQVERARKDLRAWLGRKPVLACRHRLRGLAGEDGAITAARDCDHRRVLAFCGLARPRAFRESLESLGLVVLELAAFADHHAFAMEEMHALWRRARELGADALVTSEKDRQRLPGVLPTGPPLFTARLELEFLPEYGSLEALIAWGLKDWRRAP